jgi:hypothetical protein
MLPQELTPLVSLLPKRHALQNLLGRQTL